MELIILAGMPATGKSTVAAALSAHFGYPILEKDNIKEALFDTLGFDNYARKRQLDHAANAVLLRVLERMLRTGTPVIVDNNFDTQSAEALRHLMEQYQPRCLTVFLSGQPEALYLRYVERDAQHRRHLGHILQEHYPPLPGDSTDYTMTREEFDEKFFRRGMAEFRCPGQRIDLDMTFPEQVDLSALCRQVAALLKEDAQ